MKLDQKDIDEAKAALKRFDYLEMLPDGTITAIYCKCGEKIAGLEPVRILEKKTNGVLTEITKLVALRRYSNYVEVTLVSEDGGFRHVTPTCKECAEKMTPQEAKHILVADLKRLEDTGQEVGHLVKPMKKEKPEDETVKEITNVGQVFCGDNRRRTLPRSGEDGRDF